MAQYTSSFGLVFILYFVFVYLQVTALTFLVRWCLWKCGLSARPTHREFVEALLRALRPVIKECPPMPTEEGCLVLANHVNWSDFVIDICLVRQRFFV